MYRHAPTLQLSVSDSVDTPGLRAVTRTVGSHAEWSESRRDKVLFLTKTYARGVPRGAWHVTASCNWASGPVRV